MDVRIMSIIGQGNTAEPKTKGVKKMKIEQMTSPRKGTFIPLAIVFLGSVCAYMSAGVPNPAPLFLSVCVVVFGVIVGAFENKE